MVLLLTRNVTALRLSAMRVSVPRGCRCSAGEAAVKIGRGSSSIVSLMIRGDHEVHDGSHFYQDNNQAIYSPIPTAALVDTESGAQMLDQSLSVREEKSCRRHQSMWCCENRKPTRSVRPE